MVHGYDLELLYRRVHIAPTSVPNSWWPPMLINSISGWINPSETEKGLNQKINTKLKFKIVTSEPTQKLLSWFRQISENRVLWLPNTLSRKPHIRLEEQAILAVPIVRGRLRLIHCNRQHGSNDALVNVLSIPLHIREKAARLVCKALKQEQSNISNLPESIKNKQQLPRL